MASVNTCPICRFNLISTETAKCPQCDADFTCFAVLDSIPDEMPTLPSGLENAIPEKRSSGKWVLPGAVFLLLAGLVSGLLIGRTDQSGPFSPEVFKRFPVGIGIPVKKQLSHAPFDPSAFDGPGLFSEDAEKEQAEPTDFKKISNPIRKPEAYTDYEVGEGETLWRIAQKCYGRGYYFPVLMEMNPGLGIYNLEPGARLRIFKNAGRAEQLYHQIIRVAGKRAWYGYKVIGGDSLKGIAVKLYGGSGTAQRIMNENPSTSLQPGERIQVEVK